MDGENDRRTSKKTAGDDPVPGTFKERSDTVARGKIKGTEEKLTMPEQKATVRAKSGRKHKKKNMM